MDSLMQENKKERGVSGLFWGIMVVGLLAAGGVIAYFALSPTPPAPEVRLENALREGQEFEFLKQRIVVAENRDFTTETQSLSGGIQMQMRGAIRNFTGKTLTGLEVVASVVDENGNVIRDKKAIVIPSPQAQSIGDNRSAPFIVIIDGFSPKDNRANFSFRVTGIRVE